MDTPRPHNSLSQAIESNADAGMGAESPIDRQFFAGFWGAAIVCLGMMVGYLTSLDIYFPVAGGGIVEIGGLTRLIFGAVFSMTVYMIINSGYDLFVSISQNAGLAVLLGRLKWYNGIKALALVTLGGIVANWIMLGFLMGMFYGKSDFI